MKISKIAFALILLGMFMMPAFAVSAESTNDVARARYCNIVSPSNGDTISGTVLISISASKTPNVYIDGVSVGKFSSANWDTTSYADGQHTIYATAQGASDTITVTIANGGGPVNVAPVVTITAPTAGSTVSGTTAITVTVEDETTLTPSIYIDGSLVANSASFNWDTTAYADGTHTIMAQANDGEFTDSDSITVTVDNTVAPPPSNLLQDGVTVYGSLADDADYFTWEIDVGANAANMRVVLNSGSADFDFFASHVTNDPTHSNKEFEGYTTGGEDVSFGSPAEGRWYIKVDAYSGAPENYDLTVTITYNEPLSWGNGGKYAVLVGISDYWSISDLSYCDEDATDWYNFLNAQGYEVKIFGDDRINNYPRYDGQATEANVRNALTSLAAHAVSGDEVVFATSGHGSGDGRGSSFLCMLDCSGSVGCYYDTEIASDIGQFANGVNIFVFIDHCYSGGIGPELMALGNSQYIYCTTTCTEDGYGWDDGSHQNGAWTYEFLEKYLANNPSWSMEYTFDQAFATYPHTGGDAAMEFDGNPSVAFYL